VTAVDMNRVGSIDLIDLAGICELQGRDGLPYPFWRTQPAEAPPLNASLVASRFDAGDLSAFRGWAHAYVNADIWVECRVNFVSEDPDLRVLAYRAGDLGFLASQRPGEDVVDVFALSAYDLGTAIAASAGLVQPGAQPAIEIPDYLDMFRGANHGSLVGQDDADSYDDDDYYEMQVYSRAPARGSAAAVSASDVAVLATVQSRCQPAREWGVDWDERVAVWVRLQGDGDYLFRPDFDRAVPMSAPDLGDRIDSLIAQDVAVLRRRRGLG
jgi:hypothetical protein